MSIIKKFSLLLLCFIMILSTASCSSDSNTKDNVDNNEDKASETKESRIYDTGNFSVSVPDGWYEFAIDDIWAEEDGVIDPDVLQIIKGGDNALDTFDHPYIYINYYGPDTEMMTPTMDFYENGKELDPLTTGSHIWNGFTATTLGYPIAVLYEITDSASFQVTLYTDQDKGKISLEDTDVIEILSSISVTA